MVQFHKSIRILQGYRIREIVIPNLIYQLNSLKRLYNNLCNESRKIEIRPKDSMKMYLHKVLYN